MGIRPRGRSPGSLLVWRSEFVGLHPGSDPTECCAEIIAGMAAYAISEFEVLDETE
jgi:hypothetical protein